MAIKLSRSANGTLVSRDVGSRISPEFNKIIIDSHDKTSTLRDTSSENLNVTLMMSLSFSRSSEYKNLKVSGSSF